VEAKDFFLRKGYKVIDRRTKSGKAPASETKNPPWSREELLLALELYMRNRKSPPSKTSREVESLSEELKALLC